MKTKYSICSAHQTPDINCKTCNVTVDVKYLRKIKINYIFNFFEKITILI